MTFLKICLVLLFFLASNFSKASDIPSEDLYRWQNIINLKPLPQITPHTPMRDKNHKALEIYLDHYAEVLDIAIFSQPINLSQLAKTVDQRIKKIEDMNLSSPWENWLKAEMHLHMGLIYIREQHTFKGIRNILKSHNLIKKTAAKYHDFIYLKKLQGIYLIIFDNIHSGLRFATKLLGLKGDQTQGSSLLDQYHRYTISSPGLHEECIIFKTLAFKIMAQEDQAYLFLSQLDKKQLQSPLLAYLYANIAFQLGHNDHAIQLLSHINQHNLRGDFYHISYLLGKSRLNKLDPQASNDLYTFLKSSPNTDYHKEIHYKLSLFYLISGDTTQFLYHKKQVLKQGRTLRNRDMEAQAACQLSEIPNTDLVKTELLIKGHYFERAYLQIQIIKTPHQLPLPQQTSYWFFQGQIQKGLNNYQEAINAFQKVLALSQKNHHYMGVEAAYYLACIYEKKGQLKTAHQFYKQCGNMDSNTPVLNEKTLKKAREGQKRLSHNS